MNSPAHNTSRHQENWGYFSWPLGMIVVGVLLILASLLPRGDLVGRSQWTRENAEEYASLSEQYHRAAYQSAEGAGVSAERRDVRGSELKSNFEAMQAKLERVREQPQRWSRYLLGVGTLLAAVGFFAHSAGHS